MSAKSANKDRWSALDELAGELPLVRDKDYETKVEPIASGSLSLDLAMGIGGYPRGSIVDVFGGESAGKSLLSIMAIAEVQRAGGIAIVWDAERSYSKNLAWMRVNGVDTSKLRFLRLRATQGCEIGFDAIERICKAQAADLIVVDSVPSLIPQAVLEKDVTENAKVAARANLLAMVLPRLVGICDEGKTCVMFINQMRANMNGGMYAPPDKETSNWVLKHFSTMRMKVRKASKPVLKDGIPVGHRVHVDMVKNKVAAPYRQAEFDINYLSGVDNTVEMAEILVAAGVVTKAGSWFEYEKKRFHGLPQLAEHFKDKGNYAKGLERVHSANANTFGIVNKENHHEEGEENEEGIKIQHSED